MTLEALREFCAIFEGSWEDYPFGPETPVFKIGNKIFAILGDDSAPSINLKCHPDKAIELREKFPAVKPGYHMNKKHWITVECDGSVPERDLKAWIQDSFELVSEKKRTNKKLK